MLSFSRFSIVASTLLAALFSRGVRAEDMGHVILTGYAQRGGSMSADGAAETYVYLFIQEAEARLDMALPAGSKLTLERNGQPVLAFQNISPTQTMTALQIEALYTPSSESRRKLETRVALDGALADDAPVLSNVFHQRLAQAVASLVGQPLPPMPTPPLTPEKLATMRALQLRTWTQLASRIDPNVAVARYRGYIDRNPGTALVTYELLAHDSTRSRVLGRVVIDPTRIHRLPAPVGLVDVSKDQSRCDAPEEGRAHGVAAISWKNPGEPGTPGANATDRYAHALNLVGYDVWRSAGPCGTPIELRTLATAATVGSSGSLTLEGMTRVNSTPVMAREVPASGRRDDRKNGWNPAFAQWLDTRETLEAAGLGPGDEVCYRVVARDLSGNYGDTAKVDVVIPDELSPPSPWTLEVSPDTSVTFPPVAADPDDPNAYNAALGHSDVFKLEWSEVSLKSWMLERMATRVPCNLVQADVTKRLEIANDPSGCTNAATVNLDIVAYRVYRFDDPDLAVAFVDSDGDGCDDAAEGSTATSSGQGCDPTQCPASATSFIAEGTFLTTTRPDGRRLVTWTDTSSNGPAANRGGVFWYRVAAVGRNGRVSPLGPMVRGLFPDTRKPDRWQPDQISFRTCEPYLEIASDPIYDEERPVWGMDPTGRAKKLRVYCIPPPVQPSSEIQVSYFPTPSEFIAGWLMDVPFSETSDILATTRRALPSLDQVDELLAYHMNASSGEGCSVWVDIVDDRDRIVGVAGLPFEVEPVNIFTAQVNPNTTGCTEGSRTLEPGDHVEVAPEIDVPLGPGECAGIFAEIDGVDFRLGTQCENDPPFKLEISAVGPTFICPSVTRIGSAGIPSTNTPLPCITLDPPQARPNPPRLSTLTLPHDGLEATLAWEAPGQPVAGIAAEYWRQDDPSRKMIFLPHDRATGLTITSTFAMDATLPTGTIQEWCVRAQAVSAATPLDRGGAFSEWSSPICAIRRAPAPGLPEYLPFPSTPVPTSLGPDLLAGYLVGDGLPYIHLGTIAAGATGVYETELGSTGGQSPCATTAVRCDLASSDVPPAPCLTRTTELGVTGEAQFGRSEPTVEFGCDYCSDVYRALQDRGNFVAFRQAKDSPGATPGHWQQVSPLLERPFCGLASMTPVNGILPLKVEDPYFAVVAHSSLGNTTEYRLYFTDSSPHIAGREYRYQLVFFDVDGEPRGYRTTNWFQAVP